MKSTLQGFCTKGCSQQKSHPDVHRRVGVSQKRFVFELATFISEGSVAEKFPFLQEALDQSFVLEFYHLNREAMLGVGSSGHPLSTQ